ncbi:TonB-dependent receptor [Dyadobacter sp. CY323]|uniref:SusC/RagA family TonB-linked outer membrane protein n=1 Tax=Dyadobacter sp. CY323 TaxID=2907302 RepID=UPI001F471635|nr:TonB-dependent receptor [Dyadobacter sp. CY323]MCE6989776.1 TonB-dependent receptor [Dyadobacter sp. CY323]
MNLFIRPKRLMWFLVPLLIGTSQSFSQELYSLLLKADHPISRTSDQAKSLKDFLNQVEKKLRIQFNYNSNIVRNKTIVMDASSIQQGNLLDKLNGALKQQGLIVEKLGEGKYVINSYQNPYPSETPEKGNSKASTTEQKSAVETTIRGKVTSEDGLGLPGVTILEKTSKNGTVTDADGNYSIVLPETLPNPALVFSYIGYIIQEVSVGNQTTIHVTLRPDIKTLNEIVVVGYGTQQKTEVTASIATISRQSIENQPLTGLDQAMAGQAAGIQVAQRSASPGGGVTVRVRGSGSIGAGNEPLYVVDGIPIEGSFSRDLNPLASINPNDIESIQVLKDASSAAIYGSRGANGVVLITTKRGKAGKPRIQFETYYGIQEVAKKVDLLNAREYAEYNTEARNNAWVDQGGKATDPNEVRVDRYKVPEMFANPSQLGKGTDWQDAIFRTAPVQNCQVSISGGNENTQYLVSANYFDQEGIVINSGFKRYSFRINLDTKLSERLKMGVNLSPTFSKSKIVQAEGQFWNNGMIASALSLPPTIPVYNADGTYAVTTTPSPYNIGAIENPVSVANRWKNNQTRFRVLGTVFAEYKLAESLTFKTSLGGDYNDSEQSMFYPSTVSREGVTAPVVPAAEAYFQRNYNWLNENLLTFNKVMDGKHSINALVGFTSQKANLKNASLTATNFPNDLVPTLNAGQITGGGTGISEWSLLSLLGRVNYSYQNKYLLTATIRRDGSSRFGASKKWGTFPSASVGWNVHEEQFMGSLKAVSNLKLRASYGLAGNNTIGNYGHIASLGNAKYVFGSGAAAAVNGLLPTSISNENLGWEMMRQADLGLDLGLLSNRLSLTVDYYNKITEDLLLSVPVPASTGFATAIQNIGKIKNWGWEFSLGTKNLVNALKWSTDFNISFNRNKVLALGPEGNPIISRSPAFTPSTHITQIGAPMGSFYGYQVVGVYRDQADLDSSPSIKGAGTAASRPGDLKFKDMNGDGEITSADIGIIGNNQPDFTFGMTNNFSYKAFNLNILVDGAEGFYTLNGARRNITAVTGSYSRRDVLNRWQSPENPGDGKTPRANTNPTGGNNNNISTMLVEDASFLRIRNLNLRYALPSTLFNKVIQGISVYASVQNAFTFTKYMGYNPEQNSQGSNEATTNLNPGIDFNAYPLARTYTLGLNLSF